MRKEDIVKQFTTPLGAPAFPKVRYFFYHREYLNVVYRTDRDVLQKIVPEPLEIDEPLVRFEVMRMPDTTGLGSYAEAGQVIRVRLGNEQGEYLQAMYVNSVPAIASGREISAYPKKFGSPVLFVDSDTLIGTLDYGPVRVATATMGYNHQEIDHEKAREEICAPTFMLKMLPGYDGNPRICELVRMQITEITILGAWSGPARLQLFEHALAPLADFPVREIVSASHILTDLVLGTPTIVYKYLAT
jgi:acetoacetate decarboxylase